MDADARVEDSRSNAAKSHSELAAFRSRRRVATMHPADATEE